MREDLGPLPHHSHGPFDINLQDYPFSGRKSSGHLALQRAVPVAAAEHLFAFQKLAGRAAAGKFSAREKK